MATTAARALEPVAVLAPAVARPPAAGGVTVAGGVLAAAADSTPTAAVTVAEATAVVGGTVVVSTVGPAAEGVVAARAVAMEALAGPQPSWTGWSAMAWSLCVRRPAEQSANMGTLKRECRRYGSLRHSQESRQSPVLTLGGTPVSPKG